MLIVSILPAKEEDTFVSLFVVYVSVAAKEAEFNKATVLFVAKVLAIDWETFDNCTSVA